MIQDAARRSRLTFAVKLLRSQSQRRHLLRWVRSTASDYLLATPSPWMTFDAIAYLEEHIRPGWQVFEYGSGGSTLFWLSLGASCVSVEHNPDWYALMKSRLPSGASIDYRFVPQESNPAISEKSDPADPTHYVSDEGHAYSYKNYVEQIDPFPDQYFDLVVIDGRARPSCLMHSVAKVKRNGLLVLDNADRDYYLARTQPYLKEYRQLEYSGAAPSLLGFSKTDIFIRNP